MERTQADVDVALRAEYLKALDDHRLSGDHARLCGIVCVLAEQLAWMI